MKIIFLGTNGWYTTQTGNTPCVLIDSKDQYVVFDAGNGIYKLDQYIKETKPISLFISHFHIDHISGLHCLNKFNFPQGIDVYVGEGRNMDFQTLVNPPFTSPKQIKLTELKDGKHNIPFLVEVIEQFHAYKDHGFRITLENEPLPAASSGVSRKAGQVLLSVHPRSKLRGILAQNKIIAYSGDCGISKGSLPLAKNADLLIHECSYKADHPPDTWGHVGPIEAAKLAKDAGVKKLILNHFDASQYTTLDMRKEAEKIAKEIFPNTICAVDDLVVEL